MPLGTERSIKKRSKEGMGLIEWLRRFRRPAPEPEYMDDEQFEALFEEDGAERVDDSAFLPAPEAGARGREKT